MQIIIADTETADLKRPEPPATGVAQVAWVTIDNPNGKYEIVDERCEYVDPGIPMSPGASKVNGIYDHHVQGKPHLFDVFKIENPCFFIAHNRAFDYARLAQGIDNCVGSLCTLMSSRRFLKDAPDHKLTTLVDYYGLPKFDAHDALGDVRMTLGVLNLLLEKSEMSLETLAKTVNTVKTPDVMPFGVHKGKKFTELPMSYISFVLGFSDLDKGLKTVLEMQRRIRGNGL